MTEAFCLDKKDRKLKIQGENKTNLKENKTRKKKEKDQVENSIELIGEGGKKMKSWKGKTHTHTPTLPEVSIFYLDFQISYIERL